MRATIRTKLITIFTLVVVVPVTLVGVEAYMISRRTLTSHISQGLERQAVGAVDQIDRVLFERYQNVKSWSADAIMLGVTEGDRDGRISNFLSTMQQQYGLYAGLVCVDANGRIVAASHPRLIGMDVADAPWFHPAREDPAVHVYDLAFSELFGGVSLVFAAPIRPAAPSRRSARTPRARPARRWGCSPPRSTGPKSSPSSTRCRSSRWPSRPRRRTRFSSTASARR